MFLTQRRKGAEVFVFFAFPVAKTSPRSKLLNRQSFQSGCLTGGANSTSFISTSHLQHVGNRQPKFRKIGIQTELPVGERLHKRVSLHIPR